MTVFTLARPTYEAEGLRNAVEHHDQLRAVVKAFADVGRVVRLEPCKFGHGLVLKAEARMSGRTGSQTREAR